MVSSIGYRACSLIHAPSSGCNYNVQLLDVQLNNVQLICVQVSQVQLNNVQVSQVQLNNVQINPATHGNRTRDLLCTEPTSLPLHQISRTFTRIIP